jgi:WD40 repeat protein
VKIWDTANGRELLTLAGDAGNVTSVAWSPNGERLTTGDSDGAVRTWDIASGQQLLSLTGFAGEVSGVAWSPDGLRLAAGGTDGTVQIYAMDPRLLLDVARNRITRNFTPDECKSYFHSQKCLPQP